MNYVISVSFSVLINGIPKARIIFSRGLRQGNLLYPYLFLLCTESLVSLFRNSARENRVHGIKICSGAPSVNYMIFSDDRIIFYKTDVAPNRKIQKLLKIYGKASSKKINTRKIAMVFSRNVNASTKDEIASLWSTSITQQYDKYLSIPLMINRSKRSAFSYIKTRV